MDTSTHTIDTHVMDTCTQTDRENVREKDPKHQNSINPLRRSLKGFLKADFHHTESFQVSTVCGGNGAEAFKLYTLTFPLCYFLFLPLSHSLLLSLCICPCISSETTSRLSWINLKMLFMCQYDLQLHRHFQIIFIQRSFDKMWGW